jgi:hypothetical protein
MRYMIDWQGYVCLLLAQLAVVTYEETCGTIISDI